MKPVTTKHIAKQQSLALEPRNYHWPDIYVYASILSKAMNMTSMGDIAEARGTAFKRFALKHFMEYKKKEKELAQDYEKWYKYIHAEIPSDIVAELKEYVDYFERILAQEGARTRAAKEAWKADWALKQLKHILG